MCINKINEIVQRKQPIIEIEGDLKNIFSLFSTSPEFSSIDRLEMEILLHFKEQLRSTEFSVFVSAEQVCKLLVKATFYLEIYPEICSVAQIALTNYLSATWPELAFQHLPELKQKS